MSQNRVIAICFSLFLMLTVNASLFASDIFKAITVYPSMKVSKDPITVVQDYGLVSGAFGVKASLTVNDSIIYDVPHGDLLFGYSYHSYNNNLFVDIVKSDYVQDVVREQLGLPAGVDVSDEQIEEALLDSYLGDTLTKKIVVHELSLKEKIVSVWPKFGAFYIEGGLSYYSLTGTMRNHENIKESAISPVIGFGYGTRNKYVNLGLFYDYSFAKFTADFDYQDGEETLGLGGHTFGLFMGINL